MKRFYVFIVGLSMICSATSVGQNLTLSDKKNVVEKLVTVLQENYVLQDSVSYIVPKLYESVSSDDFKKDQGHQEFSMYLTSLLRSITKDAHFGFLHNPTLSKMLSQPQNGNSAALNEQLNAIGGSNPGPASRENFYLKRAEVLDGNVGYLKLERITSLDESKATLDAAMKFLSNSDAFILDVRGNPGGTGGFIPYLMSYFFPKKKTLLYRREMPAPAWDSISYHYTVKNIPGKRLDKIPCYVLTDAFTGSAATNLAYTMQSFDRATIIGENTGSGYRGAHSASLFSLPEGFVGLVPIGKVVNARTNTNWRTEGVIPDVEVKSEDALKTAHIKALQRLQELETDQSRRNELNALINEKLEQKPQTPVLQDSGELKEYTGTYEGDRKVWIEDNELKFKRAGGPALVLTSKSDDLFKMNLPSNMRTRQALPNVQFNRTADGKVESITLVFTDEREPMGPFKKL